MATYKSKYNSHRNRTKNRVDKNGDKIEFRLTFDEWLDIWIQSGHILEMGRHADQYCMSRYNDIGHYEVGNVYIQTVSQNVLDAHVGATYKSSKKGEGHGNYGKVRSEETRKKLSEANKRQTNRGGGRPKGYIMSDETRAKIKAARLGKTFSEESKAKMSLSAQNRKKA